jgi:polyphosphate kinase
MGKDGEREEDEAREDEREEGDGGKKIKRKAYEKEMDKLAGELVRLQEWIKHRGLRVVVLFEGRDAAGKGGAIKAIAQNLNPRVCRVVALGTPTEREKTQFYFQRYVAQLPAAGEMVLFDRSWYNRAGVERVMGFCTEAEYEEFLRSCPEFERMLVRAGIILVKYWFSVSDDEQERRFQARIDDPTKHWKLSPMDLESRARWVEYSRAKDEMFAYTDIKQARWWVVNADDKRRARLNCIAHLLSQVAYEEVQREKIKVPPAPGRARLQASAAAGPELRARGVLKVTSAARRETAPARSPGARSRPPRWPDAGASPPSASCLAR